jgi:hypothetical protein
MTGENDASAKASVTKRLRAPSWASSKHTAAESTPGWDRKVRVALQWTMDLLFSKDVTQYLTVRAPAMSSMDDEDSSAGHVSR